MAPPLAADWPQGSMAPPLAEEVAAPSLTTDWLRGPRGCPVFLGCVSGHSRSDPACRWALHLSSWPMGPKG